MVNITLLRTDTELENLRSAVKANIWCALRNGPLYSSGLFPDDSMHRAEDEIARPETEHRTYQPRCGCGGYGSRKQYRYQPYQGGWNQQQDLNQSTSTSQDADAPG